MSAACSRMRGLVGARAALAACPTPQIRKTLQEMTRREGLPYSRLGGAFALDAPENRYSYLFTRNISETNVDQWILLARRACIPYVHFSGWEKTLGSYEPRPALFPNGFVGLKTTIEKIHAAGLKASTHTLTGCIAQPTPSHRRLQTRTWQCATLTLAEAWMRRQPDPLQSLPLAWTRFGRMQRGMRGLGDEVVQLPGCARTPTRSPVPARRV